MEKLHFSTQINAPKEKVWTALWEDVNYREWTSAFTEGSYAVSDWQEGSKIQFLSPEGEGMYSVIAKLIPDQFMSFKHLGTIKGGVEQPETEETKLWVGATENYTVQETNGITELTVDMDITEAYENSFKKIFPKGLEIVKRIAES